MFDWPLHNRKETRVALNTITLTPESPLNLRYREPVSMSSSLKTFTVSISRTGTSHPSEAPGLVSKLLLVFVSTNLQFVCSVLFTIVCVLVLFSPLSCLPFHLVFSKFSSNNKIRTIYLQRKLCI